MKMTFRALLIFCLLFTSCRTIKTKYGRDAVQGTHTVNNKKREPVSRIVRSQEMPNEASNEITTDENNDPAMLENGDNLNSLDTPSNMSATAIPATKSDTIKVENVQDALWAESQSDISLGFSIAAIPASIFLPASILLLIPALVFYIRGNRSRYITGKGQRRLRNSKIIMIISAAIAFAWFSFLVLAYFFF